jgi:hypothetical protein
MMIEPGHPFQRCQLNGFPRFPGGAPMNQLSLVQAVDRFSQGVDAPMSSRGSGIREIGEDQRVKFSNDVAL